MTWLFSKALCESLPYSQEQGAESSEDTFSDGEPYAQLNAMPTPHKFWRNDKTMDASNLSRFGLTLRLLTESHGEAVLTSFLEAFPVRTSPQQDEGKELTEQDQDSGLSSLESLAKYDPDTCSWKTPQYSLLGGLEEFSETWPRWGTMRDGECWALPMWGLRTKGTGSGYSLPTPTCNPQAPNKNANTNGPKSLMEVARGERDHLWPTPTVCGNYNRKGASKTSGDGLATAVKKWPTPLANCHTGAGHGPNKKGGENLQTAVKKWPTPVASMSKGSSPATLTRKTGKSRENDRLDHAVMASDGGQLNPTWVEWLMGWPIGWTDLKPLETAKFQQWRQEHSLKD
jgi:hypothetical protein